MPLQIIRQDITKMEVDAIVNTTNVELIGYSGIDMAVHQAAGPELDELCRRIAPLKEDEPTVTPGFRLKCRYIIHTCGPRWRGGQGDERERLENCYISCLNAALERGCETMAFPLISSGAYGYPKDQVLRMAVRIITEFLFEHEMTVYLCVFDRYSYELSKRLLRDITAYVDDNYVDEHKTHFKDECLSRQSFDASFRYAEAPSALLSTEARRPEPTRRRRSEKRSGSQAAMPGEASLDQWMKNLDKGFAATLFELIDKKGLTDVQCYKRANVSRKTFSKIKCDSAYRPSKQTAVAFAIALELTLPETQDFLQTAGLSLSHSYRFDVIIEYFITHGKYDIFEINEALFDFDQTLLGA